MKIDAVPFITKFKTILCSAGIIFATLTTEVKAADIDPAVLNAIASNTSSILDKIQSIFDAMTELRQFAQTWLNSDSDNSLDSSSWSDEQNKLATLSDKTQQNEQNQYNMQENLLRNFFNLNTKANTLTNINDLSYTSMFSTPLVSPDPQGENIDNATNYLTNSSGLGFPLIRPSKNFSGRSKAQEYYTNFYNTVTAVQTYNAFALSRLYLDSKEENNNANSIRSLRKSLIDQSSNSSWFVNVVSHDLGWVLRQILLYSSQNYILLSQLLEVTKQIAATSAMTNTLLIVSNGLQSEHALKDARGDNNH